MIRKVLGSLGSLLADAQEQGLAARNAVRDLRRNRRRGKDVHAERRQKGRLQVGIHIPTPNEIKSLITGTKGRWRPLLVVAIFTGLRASELRGLRWSDIDFKANELHVRQRADRFNEIGRPKSAAGERLIPFGKFVANTLKEWKLSCPRSDLDLVFPNGAGKVESFGEHHQPRTCAGSNRGRSRCRRKSQVHRHARATSLLRVVVHQSPG